MVSSSGDAQIAIRESRARPKHMYRDRGDRNVGLRSVNPTYEYEISCLRVLRAFVVKPFFNHFGVKP